MRVLRPCEARMHTFRVHFLRLHCKDSVLGIFLELLHQGFQHIEYGRLQQDIVFESRHDSHRSVDTVIRKYSRPLCNILLQAIFMM